MIRITQDTRVNTTLTLSELNIGDVFKLKHGDYIYIKINSSNITTNVFNVTKSITDFVPVNNLVNIATSAELLVKFK